jgi:glutamyl-tRNA(Gln) amidotransferase subunit D
MPNPGDSVKVHLHDEIVIGTLLPRSKLLDERAGKEILVLKLENGYNIGIDTKKIKKIELVKVYKPKTKKSIKAVHDAKKPNVLVISCGGTISSKIDYATGGVVAEYTAEDFLEMLPELGELANISALPLMDKMSEDFLPEDWKAMAKAVYDNYKKYDGFVITQGTDTMHYTSAALSFFLQDIGKPVIFTAAQRSIDRGSTDAFMNLLSAVKAAASLDASGVFICMHGTTNDDYCLLHQGTKVRKMHSLRRDAFRSINSTPVAKISPLPHEEIEYLRDPLSPRIPAEELHTMHLSTDFEEKIALVYFHPNMDPGIIDYHIKQGVKGIVLAGTALGHIALNGKKGLKKQIELCKKKKIPVLMTSQSLYGRVDPLVYSALRWLSIEGNVIYAEDMLTETAYLKLGWLLGKGITYDQMKEKILENVAGEIEYRQHPDCFLK